MKLVMAPGDTDYASMLAGVRDGVLIESMRGTRAGNPYSGHIRGGINLGYRIERGEVTGRRLARSCRQGSSFCREIAGLTAAGQKRVIPAGEAFERARRESQK